MEFSELFRRLIAFDSTSCNSNRDIAEFLSDFLDLAGCRIDHFANAKGDKINVMARTGPDGENGLMLSGHLDVVPALEPEWQSDPFGLLDAGDRYAGRGTSDMKGFIALAALAVAEAAGRDPKRGLSLFLTYDEEVGTTGSSDFVRDWDHRYPLPKAAVIGEPTRLRVVRAHKGHMSLRLELRGTSAHTGYPDLGSNAIEKAARAVNALAAAGRRLREVPYPEPELFPGYPFSTFSVARIQGGSAVNIVPDGCRVDAGVRLMPGQDTAALIRDLERVIRVDAGIEDGEFDLEIVNESPPMLTPRDAPIHRDLCSLVGQSDSYGVSFATDAGPLQKLGVDCVIFGPGDIEVAHRPNEFILKSDLDRARTVLRDLIERYCFQTQN